MQFVYIIQAGNTNLYKIGYTNNPERRIKGLQTGNPQSLRFVTIYETPNPRELERKIHDIVAREKMVGEWFEIDHVDSLIFEINTKLRVTHRELFHDQHCL